MSGGDHRRKHHWHRSERTTPERSLRDEATPPRPSKRKADQHHDLECDYDRNYDDHDHGRYRHHHHHLRSESSKHAPEPAPKLTSTTSTSGMDKKSKASVFSRISFPEEEISMKKRKISSDAPASSGHHKPSSNGYDYKTSSVSAKAVSATSGGGRKSSSGNAVEYESSDDDRHFKMKPSRYESSPPPSAEREEEPRQL